MSAHHMAGPRPAAPRLVAEAADHAQATGALAQGADLLDLSSAGRRRAAIRAALPQAAFWDSQAGPAVDADRIAAVATGSPQAPAAAVVAVAALSTWLGASPALRARDTRAARRAIDMAAVIAGLAPPALTVRGLA